MEWQPIETAPKDVRILACGRNNTFHWSIPRIAILHSDYNGLKGIVTADGRCTILFSGQAPTHWMPLPEPPKGDTK